VGDALKLQLEISASGGTKTAGEIRGIKAELERLEAGSSGTQKLAAALGITYSEASKLARELKLTGDQAAAAANSMRNLETIGVDAAAKFQILNSSLGITRQQFAGLDGAIGRTGGSIGVNAAQLAELAFRFNNVVQAVQSLGAAAQPVYDALIASNERLNAQILSSQTNLASATKISVGGAEITDPTAKINATRDAVKAALKQVEIDTQALVGVTSGQVNELFQITLTNASLIGNQSKQFPDAIAAATSLTKGWAASLKVVGIPLNQARQEINSILKGQVDQNSILAKNLNITNDQVRQWQSQGRLVDELNKRLDVFVAGNAIAARSIDGIGSNIKDLIERLSRTAGAPFLDPIIDALAAVEKYLKQNEQAITIFFTQLTNEAIKAGTTVGQAFAPLGKTLLEIGEDLGPIALSAIKGILATLASLAQIVGPLAQLLGSTVKILADFAATDLGGVVVQATAVTLALGQIITITGVLSATALPALWAAVLATTTSLGTLYASITAVATGNTAMALSIPALQTAFAALGPTIIAAEAAATGLATTYSAVAAGQLGVLKLIPATIAGFAALQSVALPLGAALAAAVLPLTLAAGLTVLIKSTAELASANEALDFAIDRYDQTAGAVSDLSLELKQLGDIRKNGVALTQEQTAREAQLTLGLKLQAESIQDQIKTQKELKNLNADQIRTRDNLIASLEREAKRIQVVTGGLVIEGKEVEKLGTSQEQYAKKVADAQRLIKSEAGGDKEQFQKAAKDVIGLAESGVKAKRISVDAAREQLTEILNNAKVDLETQVAAKEAITKLYDDRISKVKELIEIGQIAASAGLEELKNIKDDPTLEPETRRKAGQQIVAIRKEQLTAETAEITAAQARVVTLQAQQRLGELAADRETTALKLQEFAKRQEAIKVALENATGDTERQKLLAEQAQDFAEQGKLQAEFLTRYKKKQVENFDEIRTLLKAQRDLGLSSQADYNRQLLNNDQAQIDLQITQQKENLEKLAQDDNQGRNAVITKINELESKRVEARRRYNGELIRLSNEFYDQDLKATEAAKDTLQISEAQFAQVRAKNRLEQADAEIKLQQQQLKELGAADIEGRNAIEARIYELRSRRIAAFDQLYQSELEQIKRYQAKAAGLITEGEVQRSALIQLAANRELSTVEKTEQDKLNSQKKSLTAQLALAEKQEQQLARLANQARSPEQERAYQEQVRSARLQTAQAALKLLEQEGQQVQFNRTQAIKAIELTQAEFDRANIRQLSALKDRQSGYENLAKLAENSGNRQVTALDKISKALTLQNDLYKAQNDLRTALDGLADAKGDQEINRAEEAIKLREKLDKGEFASDQERINAQRRLAQITGSNTQSLSQLQEEKAKTQAAAEERKINQLAIQQNFARQQLEIQQRQADIAIRRTVIEAQISKLKADQALLDAQALITQERLNTAKAVGAGRTDLAKAQELAPGLDRDKAIADAQAKIKEAEADGLRRERAAATGVEIAKQGTDLAQQNLDLAKSSASQQSEINRLQTATLSAQQQTALVQKQTTELTERQAAALERSLRAAQGLNALPPNTNPVTEAGTGKQKILTNLQGVPPLPAITPNTQGSPDVVQAINQLQQLIRERPAKIEVPVTISQPKTDRDLEELLRVQRAAGRANL
jgi:hypothetical protein